MTQREQVKLELMMEQLLEMKQDLKDLKETILSPQGVIVESNKNTWYRKENEYLIKEIPDLIQFKKTAYRIIWILVTAIVAISAKMMFDHPV